MANTRRSHLGNTRQVTQTLFLSLILLVLFHALPAISQDSNSPASQTSAESLADREAALSRERVALEESRSALEQANKRLDEELAALEVQGIDSTQIEQARVDLQSQLLAEDNLQAEITSTQHQIDEQEKTLHELRATEQLLSNPARDQDDDTQAQLQQTREAIQQARSRLSLEREVLDHRHEQQDLLNQQLELSQRRLERLEEIYRRQQESSRADAQQSEESRLRARVRHYLERVAALRQRLQQGTETLSPALRQRLESEILSTEERIELTKLAIRLGDIDTTLENLESLTQAPETTPGDLNKALATRNTLAAELATAAGLLERRRQVLSEQLALLEQREASSEQQQRLRGESIRMLTQVIAELDNQIGMVDAQLARISQLESLLEESYETQRFRHLVNWTPLPLTLQDWQQSLAELGMVPGALLYQVQLSLSSATRSVFEAPPRRWWLLAGTLLVLVVAVIWLRQQVIPTLSRWQGAETLFLQQLGNVVLGLMERNLLGIATATAAVIIVFAVEVPPPGRSIIITLMLLWTGIKLPVDLAWSTLAAPHVPHERRKIELYRHWRRILILGGVLSAITILAHLSQLHAQTVTLFDRLFMLYLLLTVRPVLHLRGLLLQLLKHHYAQQTWFTALGFISLFLPLSLLMTAAVGLLGFLNLAWTASWYVLVFTAMLALWLILQGLLNDTARWLKTLSSDSRRSELLGLRETIRPLHQLFSLLLFTGLLVGLARVYGLDRQSTFSTAWLTLTSVILGVVTLYELLLMAVGYAAQKTNNPWGLALIRHARKPGGLIMLVAAAQLLVPHLDLPQSIIDNASHFLIMVQIGAISWLVIQLVSVLDDVMTLRYRQIHKTSLGARRAHTQIRVLRQIVRIAVSILAVAIILMTFPTIRQLGTGLLASAGAAGLIIGIAARPLFENIIAGIQIGLTQPIRLDDVVIVEGEWGRIEEINATYVVVHIWDDRRLVVPLKYFNEQPFENWTRTSGELLGTVTLTVDYNLPVEEIRQEVKRILDESDLWDNRAWGVQVTDTNHLGMELRVLLSAPDASIAWDLRCLVREKLIAFIHTHYPNSLPRQRAVLQPDDTATTDKLELVTKPPIKQEK